MPIFTDNAGPFGGVAGVTKTIPGGSLRHVDQNIETAYAHFYGLSLQKQIGTAHDRQRRVHRVERPEALRPGGPEQARRGAGLHRHGHRDVAAEPAATRRSTPAATAASRSITASPSGSTSRQLGRHRPAAVREVHAEQRARQPEHARSATTATTTSTSATSTRSIRCSTRATRSSTSGIVWRSPGVWVLPFGRDAERPGQGAGLRLAAELDLHRAHRLSVHAVGLHQRLRSTACARRIRTAST